MSEIVICRKCHFSNDDLKRCKAKEAPASNPVTGATYCEDINKDGHCEFFRPDRKAAIGGMVFFGVLLIGSILAWWVWSLVQDNHKKNVQQRQIEIAEEALIAEKKVRFGVFEAERKAKLPAKIYKVTIDGKEIVVREYHPTRN